MGYLNGETISDRDVLWRIVTLLLALAGLADIAAGLRGARRRHVLGILGCGEATARALVIGMATGAPILRDLRESPEPSGNEPQQTGDAAFLAASLRLLALLLGFLLAGWRALPGEAGPRIVRRESAGLPVPAGGAISERQSASAAPDTS